MTYYILVFLSVSLLSIGLLVLKNPFFLFAKATVALLNIMVDTSIDESAKQKKLIQKLGKLLVSFGLFLIIMLIIIGVSVVPMILYLQFKSTTVDDLDMSSFYFYGSMILGSAVLFIFPLKKEKKDYSDWSILLHKMLLDNYNISKSLFGLEKRLFKKKAKNKNENFVVVSGLARAGTTALTKLLFQSNKFHSLSYANMPFLLSVNIWGKFYRPKKNKLKQRAHGDKVSFGYDTIEALEEYFFKVFLNDKFINEKTLNEHEIDAKIYQEYLTYQSLVNSGETDSIYLAKNNNLILRFESLRKFNSQFKVVLIVRYPEYHALSLLNQHVHFSDLQSKDSFVLDYMNWLGHHEFGLNQKTFDLPHMDICNNYQHDSINYWLAIWISYYQRILSFVEDKNLILIDYTDLLESPEELLSALGNSLSIDLTLDEIEPYKKSSIPKKEIDRELEKQSVLLYEELLKHKLKI